VRSYVPDAGDIVWLSFNPQTGREQAGHRPAVVLSPAAYNAKTSLMVCCPMTSPIKNYPSKYGLPSFVCCRLHGNQRIFRCLKCPEVVPN
jgi:hypothetical protein